jgi:hypothetical protein
MLELPVYDVKQWDCMSSVVSGSMEAIASALFKSKKRKL